MLGGGVLFAVFPLVYASLFSGFYLAFMLVLLVMILRTVAIEFRSKEPGAALAIGLGRRSSRPSSLGLALLLGVAFGNIVRGRAGRRRRQHLDRRSSTCSTPFALLVGVTTVVMFAIHGGDLPAAEDRGRAARPDRAGGAAADRSPSSCSTRSSSSRWSLFDQQITEPLRRRHLAGHLPGGRARRPRRRLAAASGAAVTFRAFLALVGDDRAAAHLGRRSGCTRTCIISTIDPAYNLTIYQRRVGRQHAHGRAHHRRSSGCRSCSSTRPASTTSSGARPSSSPTATEPSPPG